MEHREQCTLNPGLRQAQAHNIQAEETCPVQDSPLQTTEVSKSRKTQRTLPCHGAVGARPYCSPEYSPDFYKLDSTLPHSKFGTMLHMKTDTFIPLQPSTKTLWCEDTSGNQVQSLGLLDKVICNHLAAFSFIRHHHRHHHKLLLGTEMEGVYACK
ncbi:uncharacterized protein LOC122999841 isoform X3 [Thunnus albacares]|uniref:uncharacterized protein LOC122999841 isoform X3 n=1 Tax=Thunnus albacares TaxID=8236 RepID=UPI001CF677A2|nr:uncharacterized protein LOC122999841 isoform X3 [Thunnus albacares]